MRPARDKVQLAKLAERQFGRVSRAQFAAVGIDSSKVTRWLADGYLHRELPRVYAVGHRARTVESDLAAALLYAGPGAALSHATAAWWLGLLEARPRIIELTTPRKCRSLKGIRVYDRRQRPRILHRRLAVTSFPHTLLDLAATAPLQRLRHALANAEYRNNLDLLDLEQVLKRGCRGADGLRRALEQHQPSLALTKSRLERMLVGICERNGIPLPEINVRIGGWEVDALWREARLAVELDGYGNHHTPAQLRRDRRKEMALRARALTPVRYSEEQLEHHEDAVAAELLTATT